MTPGNPRQGGSHGIDEPVVLAAIGGGDLTGLAANAGVDDYTLASAVQRYRSAGRTALHDLESAAWRQVDITFAEHGAAEIIVADKLAPALSRELESGAVASWWFVRKGDWRLRIKLDDSTDPRGCAGFFDTLLNELVTVGDVVDWRDNVYEPETYAFGGAPAMTVAHHLFHADSRRILDYVRYSTQQPTGRPELSLLLCSYLLRSAGLEWHEQGDVWSRVASYRQYDPPQPIKDTVRAAVRRLITVEADPSSGFVRCGPLAPVAGWLTEFGRAGRDLRVLANRGTLGRGLRAVLATHILFHWNRLGIPGPMQSSIAAAAAHGVLDGEPTLRGAR